MALQPKALAPQRLGHAPQIGPKQGGGGWLITGFGPFPRVADNPSARLARRLGQLRPDAKVHVFETAYAGVAADMAAVQALAPAQVLMLGVAPRARTLRVELRAINRRAGTARDARGTLPASLALAPGAPAFRAGRHRGMVLVKRLRGAGVKATLSRDAGRYLCNFAYWHMLAALPEARIVFVHVPMPQGRGRHDARPRLEAMARALVAMLRGGL